MNPPIAAMLSRQLTEMPAFLKSTFRALSRDLLIRSPVCDKAPLLEHLWHIRDCESDLYGLRIVQVLAEERPVIVPVDVDIWPGMRGYAERDGNRAIDEFCALRGDLVTRVASLDAVALARVGVREDSGEAVSVFGLIEQTLEHDRDHRRRMPAMLREFLGVGFDAGCE